MVQLSLLGLLTDPTVLLHHEVLDAVGKHFFFFWMFINSIFSWRSSTRPSAKRTPGVSLGLGAGEVLLVVGRGLLGVSGASEVDIPSAKRSPGVDRRQSLLDAVGIPKAGLDLAEADCVVGEVASACTSDRGSIRILSEAGHDMLCR